MREKIYASLFSAGAGLFLLGFYAIGRYLITWDIKKQKLEDKNQKGITNVKEA